MFTLSDILGVAVRPGLSLEKGQKNLLTQLATVWKTETTLSAKVCGTYFFFYQRRLTVSVYQAQCRNYD